jgi:hypothetical protein
MVVCNIGIYQNKLQLFQLFAAHNLADANGKPSSQTRLTCATSGLRHLTIVSQVLTCPIRSARVFPPFPIVQLINGSA